MRPPLAAISAAACLLSAPRPALSTVGSGRDGPRGNARRGGDASSHDRPRGRGGGKRGGSDAAERTAADGGGAMSESRRRRYRRLQSSPSSDYTPSTVACPSSPDLEGYAALSSLQSDLRGYFAALTNAPTVSSYPTRSPTGSPVPPPTASPSGSPTGEPSDLPTYSPVTDRPTPFPTGEGREPREPTSSPQPTIHFSLPPGSMGGGPTRDRLLGAGEAPFFRAPHREWRGAEEAGEQPVLTPRDSVAGEAYDGSTGVQGVRQARKSKEAALLWPTGESDEPPRGDKNDEIDERRRLDESTFVNRHRVHELTEEWDEGATEWHNDLPAWRTPGGEAEPPDAQPPLELPPQLAVDGHGGEEDLLVLDSHSHDNLLPRDGGDDGRYDEVVFPICPGTTLAFSPAPYLNETRFVEGVSLLFRTPLQRPVRLECMLPGSCVLAGGTAHVLVNDGGIDLLYGEDGESVHGPDGPHGLTVEGIRSEGASLAGVVMLDPRGPVRLRDCEFVGGGGGGGGDGDGDEEEDGAFGGGGLSVLIDGRHVEPVYTTTTSSTSWAFTDTTSTTNFRRGLESDGEEEDWRVQFSDYADVETAWYDGAPRTRARLLTGAQERTTVSIDGCSFANNTGNATIFVTSYRSEASDGEENDDEDETRQHSVRLELRDTTFENEDMATAVVHGDGAYVSMRGCAFEFGGPSGPALNVIGGGTLRLENTRFYNNGEAEEGDEDGTAPRYDEVVLGPDSVLDGNSGGNCAFGTPDSGCSGVMFSGGECDTFGEACSTPAPTDGPTFAPTAVPSGSPSSMPSASARPSDQPSAIPSTTGSPTSSVSPSILPSSMPSSSPRPSSLPSLPPSRTTSPSSSGEPTTETPQPTDEPTTPPPTDEPSKGPTDEPTITPEIITEITEVTISASVTLADVQSTGSEEDALIGLVQTLTAVFVEVVSGGLGDDRQLAVLTITAVNGHSVGMRKLRGGSGRPRQGLEDLRVDFVTIIEETETCTSARGECDRDSVGMSDEEVGAEVFTKVLESINLSVEDDTDNGFLGRLKREAASSGTSQKFENASVGSVTLDEEVDVSSWIRTDIPTASPAAPPRQETEVVSCRTSIRNSVSGSSGRMRTSTRDSVSDNSGRTRIRCHSDREKKRKKKKKKKSKVGKTDKKNAKSAKTSPSED